MSFHSGNCVKLCNPCNAVRICPTPCPTSCPIPCPTPCPIPCPTPCPIPWNPCNPCTGTTGSWSCNPCSGCWDQFPKPWDSCRCHDCKHKSKRCHKKKCDSDSDSEFSRGGKKSKGCGKCRQSKCSCVDITPYLRVRCGCIAATLTKTASPTTYSGTGTTITYSYTITNTGSAPICYPIDIYDDKLGGWLIPQSYILPGASQTFTRTYVTTAADVTGGNIVNTAFAYIKVKENKWVCTQPSSATVTYVPL